MAIKIDLSTQTLFNHLMTDYHYSKNLEMAVALSRGLRWELVAIEHEEEIKHAAVRHPDGGFFDARGHVSEEEFLKPYPDGVVRAFSLEANLAIITRGIVENDISEAGRLAMSNWPEMPWREDTTFGNMIKFFTDLRKISEYYGIWIENNIFQPKGADYDLYVTGNGEYRIRLAKE